MQQIWSWISNRWQHLTFPETSLQTQSFDFHKAPLDSLSLKLFCFPAIKQSDILVCHFQVIPAICHQPTPALMDMFTQICWSNCLWKHFLKQLQTKLFAWIKHFSKPTDFNHCPFSSLERKLIQLNYQPYPGLRVGVSQLGLLIQLKWPYSWTWNYS